MTRMPEVPAASRPLPDFVIIGAQKAGSTGLMQHLAAHPHLYLPDHETRYFRDPWFQFESPSVLADAVDTAEPGVRRRGIKCPDYLALPEAPQRIVDALGTVELIAVLREPVDRAISSYFWAMQWGLVPLEPVESGLRKILDGEWAALHPRSTEVLEYGLYGKHLTRYLDVFPREKLAVLVDEEIRADPHRAMRTVFEFLGVDAAAAPAWNPRPVNAGVYSQTRLKVLALRHKHVLRGFPGYPGRYLQPPVGLRSRLADRSIAAVDRIVLARLLDNTKPTVSAELRARLAEFYRADVELTARLLGRDLGRWLRRERTSG
jgi:sulfotransferase family protein